MTHPLDFFLKHVDAGYIDVDRDSYLSPNLPPNTVIIHPEIEAQEWLVVTNELDSGKMLYYKDAVLMKFRQGLYDTILALDMFLLDKSNFASAMQVLSSLQHTVSTLQQRVIDSELLSKYEAIGECLDELSEWMKDKMAFYAQSNALYRGEAPIKLRWLGGMNQLAQLFFDLREGQDNKPFVDIDKSLLKTFLLTHFTDFNGSPLKANTLEKYMRATDDEGRRHGKDRGFTFPIPQTPRSTKA